MRDMVLGGCVIVWLSVALRSAGRVTWRGRRRRRAPDVEPREVAVLADMVRIGVAAGLHVRAAVGRAPGLEVVGDAMRGGTAFADAVEAWAGDAGPAASELAALLVVGDRRGVAVSPALARLAADLRRRDRRAAETRARRAPVAMLLPLVCCMLPAFGLLTVVPMVVVALGALSTHR